MSLLRSTKLSPRLISAFVACALITLAVGLVGRSGISSLSDSLDDIISNSLVSVYKTSNARANAIAHYRDVHRALLLKYTKAEPAVFDAAVQSMADNQKEVEQLFKEYRQTPLADDERVAGDKFEKDWPTYIQASNQLIALIKTGDLDGAAQWLEQQVAPAYGMANDELKIIVASNSRQSTEAGDASAAAASQAYLKLGIGVLIAFLAAIALGLIITRSITRPLSMALISARHVADGDLSHSIEASGQDEISALLKALDTMQTNLKVTINWPRPLRS